ncbi:MAG TPA: DUF202 domain-containing protein [Abditibacteriaceae bacterium]|nr:DUF202 domain-containing protein [Abditibacteriaceae bacterium]
MINGTAQEDKNPARVRDHLANERTYLAWMRTAMAMMGFGVVIARLRYLLPPRLQSHGHGWELGLLFAVAGLLTVLFSTFHYFAVRRSIDNDSYESTGRWVFLFSLIVTLIGSGVLYFLFSNQAPAVSAAASHL